MEIKKSIEYKGQKSREYFYLHTFCKGGRGAVFVP